jgi:hypothetical protein
MNSRLSLILASIMAATCATSVTAMPAGGAVEKAPSAYPMDCAKVKDKARCAALNQKIAACKDKTDDAWRECMNKPTPAASFTPPKPRDCNEARNKEVCKAHAGALAACKDKPTRAEHRNCVAGQI